MLSSYVTVSCGLPVPAGFGAPEGRHRGVWGSGIEDKRQERWTVLAVSSFALIGNVQTLTVPTVDRTRVSAPGRSP